MSEVLSVKNLSVSFNGHKVLDDLSFSVSKGDILAIIGPNGAGKSVLFRALLGLVPHKGEVKWFNPSKFSSPSQIPKEFRRARSENLGGQVRIGYVPQKISADRDLPLTVGEFLNFGGAGKEELRTVLNEVGLKDDILSKKVGVLSGGQWQRLLIAWAIIGSPEVLLFDEPTAGIDIGGEETIYNLIRRLQRERNMTVLLISHDLHIVYQYAKDVLCLNKEKICLGPPHEVLDKESLAKLYGHDTAVYEHKH